MNKVTCMLLLTGTILLSCSGNQSSNKQPEKGTATKVIQLTKESFLEKVANYETNPTEWEYLGDKPAIVDFYADWCMPCRMLAPVLEELAKEFEGKIYIYKIDVDKEHELSAVFGIESLPTLLFIPMNDTPQMTFGGMSKSELRKVINEVLLK